MKQTLNWLLIISTLGFVPFSAKSQSTLEFQSGTTIEVQSGADISADNIIANGTVTGSGTFNGGPLPVEMTGMTAQATRSAVTLNWTTATETDNYGFEVERRVVSSQLPVGGWKNVGFVKGSGTSSSPHEYSFSDENLSPGRYAYRIRQIDQSGSFTYTAAVEVEVGLAPKEFKLSQNFPNPFNPTTTMEFTLPEDGLVTLKMYDLAGRELVTLLDEEKRAGYYHQVTIDASRFGSGTYFCRLEFNGKQVTRKIVLVK